MNENNQPSDKLTGGQLEQVAGGAQGNADPPPGDMGYYVRGMYGELQYVISDPGGSICGFFEVRQGWADANFSKNCEYCTYFKIAYYCDHDSKYPHGRGGTPIYD